MRTPSPNTLDLDRVEPADATDCDDCGAAYGADHDGGCPVLTMHERDPDDAMDAANDRHEAMLDREWAGDR